MNNGDFKNVMAVSPLVLATEDEEKWGFVLGATGKRGLTPTRDTPPHTATMVARIRNVQRIPPRRVRRRSMSSGKTAPLKRRTQ